MFGTLCAVDPSPMFFSDKDVQLLTTFSKLIANGINLEKTYRKNFIQEKRLQNDLDLAKRVQRSVLSDPIHEEDIRIDPYYKPSEALSGDMYCWFELSPSKYGVIILDVMGHGVSASLISMSIRSVLNGYMQNFQDPTIVMKKLNTHINNLFNKETITTYMTGIYLTIDMNKKEIDFVNAGHPPGVVIKDKTETVFLDKRTLPLGIFGDTFFEKETISFDDSVSLLLYTDGLIDALEMSISEGVSFIGKLLGSIVKKKDGTLHGDALSSFGNFTNRPDDICFISIEAGKIKMNPKKANKS